MSRPTEFEDLVKVTISIERSYVEQLKHMDSKLSKAIRALCKDYFSVDARKARLESVWKKRGDQSLGEMAASFEEPEEPGPQERDTIPLEPPEEIPRKPPRQVPGLPERLPQPSVSDDGRRKYESNPVYALTRNAESEGGKYLKKLLDAQYIWAEPRKGSGQDFLEPSPWHLKVDYRISLDMKKLAKDIIKGEPIYPDRYNAKVL